jgi:hypothetical protein
LEIREKKNVIKVKEPKEAERSLLADWFLRILFNDPTPLLHFCDYLLFEDSLALYLYN